MIGRNTPPALAVDEGMAGEMMASAKVRPYARPMVLLPYSLTNRVATLSPRPVWMNPLAKKKEITINQMTSFENAPNASAKLRVRVATATVSPANAQAPTGRGPSTRPVTVERKMDSSFHALGSTPTGTGQKRCKANPIAMEATMGTILAPSHDSIHPFFASLTPAADTIGTGADPECACTFHEGSFRATKRLSIHRKPAVFDADGRTVVRFVVGIPPTRHLRLQLHVACVGMAMAGSCGRGR
mmetsp:Transcript_5329/g.18831  ORF Transcript_5329/g.18831 Transcript_5329/m.18831 type:complete len:243 (-) Transcript_5329:13-741(-)